MMTKPLAVQDKITARVSEFCEMSGISEREVYRRLKSGKLRSIKFGRLRLIDVEHYRRMVSELGARPYHGNEHGKIT